MTRASSRRQFLGGVTRAEYGCIVTFENAAAGDRLTLHRTGPTLAGLREACAIALARDESFRLCAYSTPETILADISGGRADVQGATQETVGVSFTPTMQPALPEAQLLARIGRRELLQPRLASRRPATGLRE